MSGNCLDKHLIYQCTVKSSPDDEGVNYIGLTENTFKTRWNQHKHTFRYESKANSTELSKYVWKLQSKNIVPLLSWKVIDHAKPYKNGGKSCNLCMTEKYHIITSKDKIINKRTELISTCRHMSKFLLKTLKMSLQTYLMSLRTINSFFYDFITFLRLFNQICRVCFSDNF